MQIEQESVMTYATPPTERFNTKEAADYLKFISPDTLTTWRSRGLSPIPFYRVARRVFYKKSDLDRFLEMNRVEQI
ncbi:MAG TPA: helix-turn-helix domain-containing protein [Candidatus Competibacteraceae bacterium]|nr:helix-turn-helix domain-containing protein [Candidatus Competibacteraceae bacterium]